MCPCTPPHSSSASTRRVSRSLSHHPVVHHRIKKAIEDIRRSQACQACTSGKRPAATVSSLTSSTLMNSTLPHSISHTTCVYMCACVQRGGCGTSWAAGLAHIELTRSPSSWYTTYTPDTHERHTQPGPRRAPSARILPASCTRAPVQGILCSCVLIAALVIATPETPCLPLDSSLLHAPYPTSPSIPVLRLPHSPLDSQSFSTRMPCHHHNPY